MQLFISTSRHAMRLRAGGLHTLSISTMPISKRMIRHLGPRSRSLELLKADYLKVRA